MDRKDQSGLRDNIFYTIFDMSIFTYIFYDA